MKAKYSVLIAEDMDILREDYRGIIDSDPLFITVSEASTGAEALKLYAEHRPDIVLMDIEMEDAMSGIRASEAIISISPEAKIIYLTAHETRETIITAMATGASDYLVKGCPKEHILSHMRDVAEGKPMLDRKIQDIVLDEYKRLRRSEKSLVSFISRISALTPAERELVRYLIDGYKVKEIAGARCVEIVTVKTQIHSLLTKFDCRRTSEVVRIIEEMGISQLF